MGRPSEYTPEKADIICARIAEGQSIRTICADEEMPAIETFYRWIRTFPEFQEQYARAKEDQADAMAEEMLDIADDANNDWMERLNKDDQSIGWQINGEHVQRSRLRLDTRKWLASKLKPKKYGDSILNKHADADGNNLLKDAISFISGSTASLPSLDGKAK